MKRSLTKSEIIRGQSLIKTIYSTGQTVSEKGMKLIFMPNSEGRSRILVTFCRGFGNSVERNRAKRQSKEVFRIHKDSIKPGFDLCVVLYPGEYSYSDRSKQMLQLFKRSYVLP